MVMQEGLYRSFFPHVLEIAPPDFTRKDAAAGHSLISLLQKHEISIAVLTSLRTSVNVPSQVTTQQSVLSYRKPANWCHQVKRIPSWMSEHPVFCSILKQISDDHQYPDDQFVALA